MVWCGVVWCGVVWCGVVWCGMWGLSMYELWILSAIMNFLLQFLLLLSVLNASIILISNFFFILVVKHLRNVQDYSLVCKITHLLNTSKMLLSKTSHLGRSLWNALETLMFWFLATQVPEILVPIYHAAGSLCFLKKGIEFCKKKIKKLSCKNKQDVVLRIIRE